MPLPKSIIKILLNIRTLPEEKFEGYSNAFREKMKILDNGDTDNEENKHLLEYRELLETTFKERRTEFTLPNVIVKIIAKIRSCSTQDEFQEYRALLQTKLQLAKRLKGNNAEIPEELVLLMQHINSLVPVIEEHATIIDDLQLYEQKEKERQEQPEVSRKKFQDKSIRFTPRTPHPHVEPTHLKNEGESYHLLSSGQRENVKRKFMEDPSLTKIRRVYGRRGEERIVTDVLGNKVARQDYTEMERDLKLPFSVIATFSADPGTGSVTKNLFVLYEGKARLLGKGGFGGVKLAQDLDTGEWVAVKIQHSPIEKEAKFMKTHGMLKGTAQRGTKGYLSQELFRGKNLFEELSPVVAPEDFIEDINERMHIAIDLLKPISLMHDKNELHRDIKPSNIIYDRNTKKAHLLDFGISEDLPIGAHEIVGHVTGTPGYMAPEIIEARDLPSARYSKASDIYACGITLEYMFDPIIKENPSAPFSQEIEKLISQMKSSDPKHRPTAGDTIKILHQIAENYDLSSTSRRKPSV